MWTLDTSDLKLYKTLKGMSMIYAPSTTATSVPPSPALKPPFTRLGVLKERSFHRAYGVVPSTGRHVGDVVHSTGCP